MARKKILITLAVLVFAFGLGVFVKTQAAPVTGWLWGGSEDCDMDRNNFKDVLCGGNNTSTPLDNNGDGIIPFNGNEAGLGRINASCSSKVDTSAPFGVIDNNDAALSICNGGTYNLQSCNGPEAVSCPVLCQDACSVLESKFPGITTNYKLNVPSSNGNITGYIWSNNIGWVDFDPQDHCGSQYAAASCTPPPLTGCNAATGVTVAWSGNTGTLTGCARIVGIAQESVSGNNGGWDGWLRMNNGSGDATVTIDKLTGNFSGYAWNSEVESGVQDQGLGWVRFTGVNIPPSPTVDLKVDVGDGNGPQDFGRVVLSESQSLPKTITLSWNVTNWTAGTNCVASCPITGNCGTWTGDPTNGGTKLSGSLAKVNVDLISAIVNYNLKCTNSGGDSGEDNVPVEAGCYTRACSGSTCQPSPGTFYTSPTYTCEGELCTRNDQCQSGEGEWKEIAP